MLKVEKFKPASLKSLVLKMVGLGRGLLHSGIKILLQIRELDIP